MFKRIVGIGLLFSILLAIYLQEPPEPLSKNQHYMGKSLHEHFLWAEKEYGIRPFAIGGHTPSGIERTIHVSMKGELNVSENEARLIFLNCVYDLLRRINANRELRPYLVQYPFAPENVEYSINFNDLKGGLLSSLIYHMQTFRGIILYDIWDVRTNRRSEILRESYPEADEKVKEHNSAK